ncbi:MAG: hypothetical protein ABIH27_05025 [Candidatus Omnitrophota bacterium]
MNKFQRLFGIKNTQIKEHCLILPLIPKGVLNEFNIKKLQQGKLYACANNDDFSLIHTGMNAGLVGDAVLYLKDSRCKKIVLFGSCGLIGPNSGLKIGSLVVPFKCYSQESFSIMLLNSNKQIRFFSANRDLFNNLLNISKAKKVTCVSVSSLKLEEERLDIYRRKGIEAVDMECSAFFSASAFTGIKAVALFYLSDIIKNHPFYQDLKPDLAMQLSLSIKNACCILREFIQNNQGYIKS